MGQIRKTITLSQGMHDFISTDLIAQKTAELWPAYMGANSLAKYKQWWNVSYGHITEQIGYAARLCARPNCRKAFASSVASRKYCRPRCRFSEEQARQRRRQKEALELERNK